jgi:anaerobic selenocysteine-containing dehydrogenase
MRLINQDYCREMNAATEVHTVNGTCHHDCPDSCGWTVTVENDVAVKLRGNPEHPFAKGELCPKINRFLERVYSPDRVTTPLRRTGPKGSGSFEPITWDEALTTIATRWKSIISTHGSEAIMGLMDAGNQSLLSMHAHEQFMQRLGASESIDNVCGQAAGVGWAATYGNSRGGDPESIQHAKCIVLWGTNTRLTNRHLWPYIETARAAGATVICIDPLRTMTATESDVFVQPLPGTDTALMLGLVNEWIRNDRIDHEYVRTHANGFDDLAAEAALWTAERVGVTCGIPAADVVALAATIAAAPPAHFRTLIGAEHREHGAQFFRLLATLPVLLGSWRHRGGGASRSTGVWTRSIASPVVNDVVPTSPPPRSLAQHQMAQWLTDTTMEIPVASLLVWNFNPLVTLPNAELSRVGLSREDLFTVVHEQFLTDTALYADIVLPATTQIESSDVVQSWGSLHVNWNEAAIEPVGESVSNAELFRRLSAAMGYTEASLYLSDADWLRQSMPGTDPMAMGITADALRQESTMRLTVDEDVRPYAHGGFATPDGKARLSSTDMESRGLGLVGTYLPSTEGLGGSGGQQYPLSLMTPKVHTRFLNGSYAHLPNHGGRETGPWVELTAADASGRGIAEGDLVEVFNHRATLQLPARIGTLVRDGVVAVPFGWHGAAHADGRTANALTNDQPTSFGGGVAYSDTMVQVRKLG